MIYQRKVYDPRELKQRSEEWFIKRMGKFTSSAVHKLFTAPTVEQRAKRALIELREGKWTNSGRLGLYSSTEINRAIKFLGIEKEGEKQIKASLKKGEYIKGATMVLDYCEAFSNVHVFSKGAQTYILEKASDFIYFDTEETTTNADMLRGIIDEDYAKQAYIEKHELSLEDSKDVGFVDLGFGENEEDLIFETGSSPDMLVRHNGLLEVKCPNRINHMKNIMYVKSEADLKEHHENYYWQVHHQIWCTGRDWCNWMSFDRSLTQSAAYSNLAMHFVLIQRDEEICRLFERVIPLACQLRDEFTELLLESIK